MKNLALPFACALLFLHACQKEPVIPDPNDEPDESTVLAEAVIGRSGGILETEYFRLSFPEGPLPLIYFSRCTSRKQIPPWNRIR